MTLAHTLERSGHTARTITVAAKATFGIADHAQTISRSQLDVSVDADGLDEPTLRHAAEVSGRYCPVSNTLRTGGVQLDVRTRMHSSWSLWLALAGSVAAHFRLGAERTYRCG